MSIFFITGAAGAGKTTVAKDLHKTLPKERFLVYDIDQGDRWVSNSNFEDYNSWLAAKVDYWLQRSKSVSQGGIDVVVSGIVYPQDITSAPTYSPDIKVNYILLDADPETIRQRFTDRRKAYTESSGASKQSPEATEKHISRQIEISNELRSACHGLSSATILDTSELSPKQVTEIVGQLVV